VSNRKLLGLLERAGEFLAPLVALRDGILVIGAGCYLLGYAAWSLYAWANHLGLLPLLSAQYVVAGATTGVYIVLALFIARGMWLLRARLPVWLDANVQWKLTIRWAISVVSSLALIIGMLSSVFAADAAVTVICMYVFAFGAFLTVRLPQLPAWLQRVNGSLARMPGAKAYGFLFDLVLNPGTMDGLGKFYGMIFSALIPFLFLLLAIVTFVLLPQELGGARPACAFLDVDWSMVSDETKTALLAQPAETHPRVARSVQVDVLFAGGDTILVRRRAPQPGEASRVHEISAKLITARVGCD
jgi:hypothetical protein